MSFVDSGMARTGERGHRPGLSRRLRAILAADAVWDALLGIVLCLVPWPAFAQRLGLPVVGLWPLFVAVGVGCFAFAVVLARAARGRNTVAVARLAAISNGVAVIVAAILLVAGSGGVVAVAGVGCGLFAVFEWFGARRAVQETA